MNNRIKEIMETNNLSAAQFADKIGVTRSGLSHVLSGRNKASLDYVLKILKSFPQIDSNWLLTGENEQKSNFSQQSISKNNIKDNPFDKIHSSFNSLNKKLSKQKNDVIKEILPGNNDEELDNNEGDNSKKKRITKHIITKEKEIDKIVFFYNDGSFKVYS